MPTDRARQFLPFDALKGFKEAIKEKEKVVVEKVELSEEQIELISRKLLIIKKGCIVTLTHYINQEYVSITGMVSNIDLINHTITIIKTKIRFEDIYDITEIETPLI